FLILYCFFLCLIRRLTGSALFPYTTLFRSLAGVFTCIYFVARRGIGAWYFQKKTPEAMQAAIFWDPQNAQYYDALATLRHFYADSEDPNEQVTLYERATSLSPQNAQFWAHLGA